MINAANKKNKNFLLKSSKWLVLWTCLIAFFGTITISHVSKLVEQKKDINEIKAKIVQEQNKNDELKLDKDFYESDEFVEKISREVLGYIKPDEIIFIERK